MVLTQNDLQAIGALIDAKLAPVLEQRLNESLEQFYSALARRPKPLDPNILNDRLVTARWSI